LLCRHALDGKAAYISALSCVLGGNGADVTFFINIKNCILIQVFRLRYAVIPELNVKGVGVVEVAYSLRQLFGRYPYATEWSSSRRILRSPPPI
jgi:hypothetical protein